MERDGAYACAEDKDSPVVDFLRVIFHGFVAAGLLGFGLEYSATFL